MKPHGLRRRADPSTPLDGARILSSLGVKTHFIASSKSSRNMVVPHSQVLEVLGLSLRNLELDHASDVLA
jgi:hypothetical protein